MVNGVEIMRFLVVKKGLNYFMRDIVMGCLEIVS